MKRLNIIVIGAGMGGLSAATALRQAGHHVEVYDRVSELRPAGAAISVWSNGIKVLNQLGLGDAIAAAGGQMDRMAYYHKAGNLLTDFSLEPLYTQVEQRAYPIARTELQRILLNAVGEEHVHLGMSCVDFNQTPEGVMATFEDGSQTTGDLLVIADGTHSRLRDKVVGFHVERRYAGYVNWNGSVPATKDLAPATSWVQYVGDHQRVSMMPMGGAAGEERFYFFFDVPQPTGSDNNPSRYRDELSHHFSDWAAPVQRLIERLDPATMARVEIHDIAPLPTLVSDRVALLGDAGHGMAPDLGQGGCQAMEDAWVLARCLDNAEGSSATDTINQALAAYDAARCERVADIITRARKRAETTHGKNPQQTQQWYEELAVEDGHHIIDGMCKTILSGPLE
ncbi:FAD-dependent urate hydroxylase HpxO [Phytohalomonas tamaricis]|uniref:FAD-dependent urate hydroxylase HpxO n=1 Tax=Phytohalomonas tamaricis TaxID=2081032 RepID=UPI000D0B1A2A|nr:FAD-dependent urate hydroxylase HpxO [Phytohalomonas tamaricis]